MNILFVHQNFPRQTSQSTIRRKDRNQPDVNLRTSSKNLLKSAKLN